MGIPQKVVNRLIASCVFLCLIAFLSSRYYAEPQLVPGMLATVDIRAPYPLEIEDRLATQRARDLARQRLVPEYRFESEPMAESKRHLGELITQAEQVRAIAGTLPYLAQGVSVDGQRFLRALNDEQWRRLQREFQVLNRLPRNPLPSGDDRPNPSTSKSSSPIERRVLQELLSYDGLWDEIAQARQRYQAAEAQLSTVPAPLRDRLLHYSDEEWRSITQRLWDLTDTLYAIGIPLGLPSERQLLLISSLGGLPTDPRDQTVVLGILQLTIRPNMTLDYAVLESMQQQIATGREHIQMRSLDQGEVIVKSGETLTRDQFEILDRLGLTERQVNWWGICGVVVVTTGMLLLYRLWQPRLVKLHCRDQAIISLVCLSTILAAFLLQEHTLALLPLAFVGLTLGSFYGSRLALVTTLGTGLLIVLGVDVSWVRTAPLWVGALIAAVGTNRPLTRSHIAAMGVLVAFIQALMCSLLGIAFAELPPLLILISALQYGASGLLSSILALGAIPYLEQFSYALTPFRLAELANLDRPLLRRLVTEAPGTFQHTLFVANLAEAGARELGADTTLVRTGTLYHDIGKTLQPQYFIENQMGQSNPHDEVDDPWKSARIIKDHVTSGLKLAQRYHLPELLQAFIPEHQGTIVISYFYGQAQRRSPENTDEADFRYDGPIPQSRETGIVMLADACEAALRALGNETTVEEASEVLLRIFESRWQDGQLRDSGLTRDDLKRLAPVFFRVWRERNHGRIKYPAFAKKVDPTGSAMLGQNCDSQPLTPLA
ncbi:MAG: HDIG domain-containing protein [Oscillatoriales cyanobacterium SM2_2_1]|nr:HDIG domain-containing protein [Oscillatoriales cyanobacterium SM2_2_1]